MSDTRPVFLIDLSSLFWTSWHATAEQPLSAARENTLAAVRRCLGYADNPLVAICCDAGRSFRKDLSAEYKANRPEKDANALAELDRVKQRLIADGHWLAAADGFEADDVIATITRLAVESGHESTIFTADKDLLQLCQPGVVVIRTYGTQWSDLGHLEVAEKFGVIPSKLGDWLALVGDKSDNIAGCPGCGPVNATKLLAEFGSLDAIWDALTEPGRKVGTPKIEAALRANVAQIAVARKLVALRYDAPVDFQQIYVKREVQKLTTEVGDLDDDVDFDDTGVVNEEMPPEATAPKVEASPGAQGEAAPVDVATTAIAVRPPSEFSHQLEPSSPGSALKLAHYLYDSRLYPKLGSPEAILAVIMRGRGLGLTAGESLDVFFVVEGRLASLCHFIIGRAMEDPDCEYFMLVESTAERCIYETKHRKHPKPTRMEYTLAEAQAAGLVKPNSAWVKSPKGQIRKTCGVFLARVVYPMRAIGLYGREEFGLGEEEME